MAIERVEEAEYSDSKEFVNKAIAVDIVQQQERRISGVATFFFRDWKNNITAKP